MQDRGKPREGQLSGPARDKTQEELAYIDELKLALANPDADDGADRAPPRSMIAVAEKTPPKAASKAKLKPLAKTNGHRGERRPLTNHANSIDAKEHFTTGEAARYCAFRTPGGLRKAWRAMQVFPIGRRGGRNTLVWQRTELDRFLRGEPLLKSRAQGLMMPPDRTGTVEDVALSDRPEGSGS